MPKRVRKPEYIAWLAMRARCYYAKNQVTYRNHGARGITVCDQWRHSFATFLRDMGPRPGPEYSLERKDNNGNYEPGNCKWATRTEQRRNTRTNRLITFNGRTQPQSAWQEETGLMWDTIYTRLKRGWSVEKTLTTPVRAHGTPQI